MKRACKQYHFEADHRSVHVKVLELLDPNFGLYVWPSSLVLAEYIFDRLDLFQPAAPLTPPFSAGTKSRSDAHARSTGSPKIVLELGAGTALPTLLLAKATDPKATFLIATDRPDVPSILDNIREALKENQIPVFDRSSPMHESRSQGQLLDGGQERHESRETDRERPRVEVRGLGWGDFSASEDAARDPMDKDASSRGGGLLQLLKDVGQSVCQERDGSLQPGRIDILLGSDTFYNPPDFEPLLSTVAYIIHRHNPECVFLTSYQNRSTKRNIDHLLKKWDLEGREIDWQEFGFDMSKYVVGGDDDGFGGDSDSIEDRDQDQDKQREDKGTASSDDNYGSSEDMSELEEEDEEEQEESQTDGENMDYWIQLAKQEIENQTRSSVKMLTPSRQQTTKISATTKISPLVDYGSSSSDDEDEISRVNPPVASSEDGMAGVLDQSDSDDNVEAEGQGQDPPMNNSSHQLGDGGALNSVHLLWICKRGRADSLFEAWRSKTTK